MTATRTLIHHARKCDADGIIENFWMLTEGGIIQQVGTEEREMPTSLAEEIIDANGDWLTPGFVDIHGHGGHGTTFDDGGEAIRNARDFHLQHGTTRQVLSLVSAPVESLEASLRAVAREASLDPGIIGSHLEGPFLSPLHKGAHDPNALTTPTPQKVEALLAAAGGTLAQITIAPELDGGREAVAQFVAAGVKVAVGHTDATYEQSRAAFDEGASLLTHAFNAMPPIYHRKPGPVIAAAEDPGITLEAVNDTLHVVPPVIDVLFRIAAGRVALVTDAMEAAGMGDGSYRLGSLDVQVRSGLATLAGTDTIAGSTLTMDAAVRNAITVVGIHPVAAVAAATSIPAHAIGLGQQHGRLRPGCVADSVLLSPEWSVRRVFPAITNPYRT